MDIPEGQRNFYTALMGIFGCLSSFGLPEPYSWPYISRDRSADFIAFQQQFRFFHTAAFFQFKEPPFLYPAPLAIFYHLLFTVWGHRSHVGYLLLAFTLCVTLVAVLLFFQALRRRNTAALPASLFCFIGLVCSYPLYFEIQRGNVEVIVWVALMLAVWAFRARKLKVSALALGFAIAFKWYPIVLLGLFVYRKKYKAIPIALFTAVAVTVISCVWLGPSLSVAFRETSKGMQQFVELYGRHWHGEDVGYDHSIFGAFKMLSHPFHPNVSFSLNVYLAIAALSGVVLYFARIRKLPVVNQICALVLLSITLPPVSYDYTLLHLYLCFGVFTLYVVGSFKVGRPVIAASWAMIAFAFAMAPHSYIIYHGNRYCGQFRFIGLAFLLYIFLRFPFEETQASDVLYNQGAVFAPQGYSS